MQIIHVAVLGHLINVTINVTQLNQPSNRLGEQMMFKVKKKIKRTLFANFQFSKSLLAIKKLIQHHSLLIYVSDLKSSSLCVELSVPSSILEY